jgi:3-mercaptopyruvate sulfurtransferase SseA
MTKRLMVFGYDGVRLFAGGMSEWLRDGYPVARVTPAGDGAPAEGD